MLPDGQGLDLLSPLDKTWMERDLSLFRCIIRSHRWRLWRLHNLWLGWQGHLLFSYLIGLWAWLLRSGFFLLGYLLQHCSSILVFPLIDWELLLLLAGSMSPSRVGLLWLLIISIAIEITAYLFSRELEMDLSRSDVDDRVGGVEEWSS